MPCHRASSVIATRVELRTASSWTWDLDLSAYDAQYVAAALALGGVLVTEDRGVLARAPSVARSLVDFVTLE